MRRIGTVKVRSTARTTRNWNVHVRTTVSNGRSTKTTTKTIHV